MLVRNPGDPDKVYVQCHNCKELVASYVIAPLGYYHHGKGYESFLRGVHRSGDFLSGRNINRLYEERKTEEMAQFQKVLEHLNKKEEDE
ncbi:MAG: hypothetical protein MI974_01505 [Chitinophagales bacterium]|nr:hypothetical protein [Chitinophagales bacterium]